MRRFFVRVHARYTRSPHLADLSTFAEWLMRQGYSLRYAQRLVFRVMRSLEAFSLPPGSAWTSEELARAFHRRHPRKRSEYHDACYDFRLFLQSIGRLKLTEPAEPHAALLTEYRRYMCEVQGLAPDTIVGNLWEVGTFLRHALPRSESVARISADTVEEYIRRRAAQVSRRSLRHTVDVLRVFLRYCFEQRLIATRLDMIERPLGFRDELPPRALKWSLIQKLLRSIDRNDRTGWRDFMLLHLMAHYGLRNGEIVRLRLESIDWSAPTLLVEQSKTKSWLKLPLLKETVPLLRRYVDEHRPANENHHLFQNGIAPYGPMTKFSVSQVFKIRARASGLPLTDASAYCLRHSFAMRLFARGVGIKAIGDLMGHNSLVSTAVYLRLQTDMLREVALPVPPAPKAAKNAA